MSSNSFIKSAFIIYFMLVNVRSYPRGKYCQSIMGNDLNITFSVNNISNISANIFGEIITCNEAEYLVNGNNLEYNKNPNSCLNKHLYYLNACPCPPLVSYIVSDNQIQVRGTHLGDITLNVC